MDSNQLARLLAGTTNYEYRVWTGPRRGYVAEQDVTEGAPYTATATTTLASNWDGSATTMTLTDASGFASAGAVYTPAAWIGTPGVYVGYSPAQWIAYTGKAGNVLTGVFLLKGFGRSVDPDNPVGAPPPYALGLLAGVTLTAWAEITQDVIGVEFAETADEEIATWQASLTGYNYNAGLMAQNNSVMVQVRWSPHPGDVSNWSDWAVLFHGYFAAGQHQDDYRRGATWTLPVRPIDQYLANSDAPARSYGRANLALGQSTNAATALTDASLIGHSGEVVGSPDLGSDNVTDESLGTVYCAATSPSRTAGTSPGVASGEPFIGEIGWGPVGSGDNGAYIVVWGRDTYAANQWDLQTAITPTATGATLTGAIDASQTTIPVTNPGGLAEGVGTVLIGSEEINYAIRRPTQLEGCERAANGSSAASHSAGAALTQAARLITKDLDLPSPEAETPIIYCRDRATFDAWCKPQGIEVIEWRSLGPPWQSGEQLNVLRQAGEKLRLRGQNVPGATYTTRQTISWGSMAESGWPTGAMGYGQALRCTDLSAPSNPANWEITNAPEPGRNVQATAQVHLAVEVGEFAITLAADIGTGDTTIQITPTSAGLDQAGGTIQIDVEQITYTAASYVTGNTYQLTGCSRGANATTPATHSTGATIYQVESATAIQMERIDRLTWKRKRVLASDNRPIVPVAFDLYASTLASPTWPDPTDPATVTWKVDWTRLATVDGHTETEWAWSDAVGVRARHLMIVILEMSDSGRALMNEVEFYRAPATDPSSRKEGSLGDVVTTLLVSDFGLDAAQVSAAGVGSIGSHLVQARTRYLALLQELARMAGCVVVFGRANTVAFLRSPYHPQGLLSVSGIVHAFSRATVKGAPKVVQGQRNRISQIRLTCRNPESQESFLVQWPPLARALGSVVEVDRVFFGSEADALGLAELIYKQANAQTTVTLSPRGSGDGLRILDRVTLTYDLDRSDTYFNQHNFLITGISLGLGHPFGQAKRAEWSLTLREYVT